MSSQLPNPNINLSRSRHLNASNVRDEELDAVFRDKVRELKEYLNMKGEMDYETNGIVMAMIEKVRDYGIKVLQF